MSDKQNPVNPKPSAEWSRLQLVKFLEESGIMFYHNIPTQQLVVMAAGYWERKLKEESKARLPEDAPENLRNADFLYIPPGVDVNDMYDDTDQFLDNFIDQDWRQHQS